VTGPEARFDALIHVQPRLRIASLLAPADWVEFGFLRDRTELSDSALSKQLGALERAAYLQFRKGSQSGRRKTWVRLTDQGRGAFAGHVAALESLIVEARAATDPQAGQASSRRAGAMSASGGRAES